VNNWIADLRIRTHLIAILIVAGLGGLAIAGAISANFSQLQLKGGEVSRNSLALNHLQHFVSSMEQMLITADLVIASGETYLAGGLSRQVSGLKEELGALSDYDLLAIHAEDMARMDALLQYITEGTALQLQNLEESANLAESVVVDYDRTAEALAALSERIYSEAAANTALWSDQLAQDRVMRGRLVILLAILYVLMIFLVLHWALNRIASPLQKLTVDAEDAMELNRRFRFNAHGPTEIQRLGNTIDRFVNSLETTVERRTSDLQEKTLALEKQIEARKKTEVDLNEAMRAAEASARAKSDFLSVVSHELRTPLTAVLGTIELLKDSELDAEQRIFAETAHRSGNVLLTLVNDILDMSKIEAGHLNLELANLRIDEIVAGTIEIFNSTAIEKGLVLGGMVEPDMPLVVRGDPLRVRQVLMNLVSNAIKFTEHGHVYLKAGVGKQNGDSAEIIFDVWDSGIGIDARDQEKLFVEFAQLDSSYTRRHGGTGLGLAISKKLVEMMGGELTVESTPGSGSRFRFSLPLAVPSDPEKSVCQQPLILASQLAHRIIAVIGNHAQLADTVAQILAPWSDRDILRTEADLLNAVKNTGLPPTAIICGGSDDTGSVEAGRRLRKRFGRNIRLVSITPDATLAPALAVDSDVFDLRYLSGLQPIALLQAICDGNTFARETRSNPKRANNGGGSILLVEDSEANSLITSEILSKAGYSVDAAMNGEQAVSAANNGEYDIVLMDLQMPVMDGYDATTAIRQLASPMCDVPIVALTANVMAESEAAQRGIRLDGFLSKPLAKNDLLETVQHWISVSQSRRNRSVASA
jgi:two-component system sensor histidine kinase BarA